MIKNTIIVSLIIGFVVAESTEKVVSTMSARTVTTFPYRGLVERLRVDAQLLTRDDGRPYASSGDVVPIHCCGDQQVKERAATTHHYCDIFSEEPLAPLAELAYVRLDDDKAEKVFINRTKRILLVSADGSLAQWRAAPSFESGNHYLAGAPLVNKQGALVSLVTARVGNHYAVSTFEGEGGYFDTPHPWKILETPDGHLVYGDRTFPTRDALREYVNKLPPAEGRGRPVLHVQKQEARITLVADGGRQLAHIFLPNVIAKGVEYL